MLAAIEGPDGAGKTSIMDELRKRDLPWLTHWKEPANPYLREIICDWSLTAAERTGAAMIDRARQAARREECDAQAHALSGGAAHVHITDRHWWSTAVMCSQTVDDCVDMLRVLRARHGAPALWIYVRTPLGVCLARRARDLETPHGRITHAASLYEATRDHVLLRPMLTIDGTRSAVENADIVEARLCRLMESGRSSP